MEKFIIREHSEIISGFVTNVYEIEAENTEDARQQILNNEVNPSESIYDIQDSEHMYFENGENSYGVFEEKYKPISREDDESNIFWETYGEDYEKVLKTAVKGNFVWTVVDGPGDSLCLIPGVHLVNRLNYVICEVEYDKNTVEQEFIID